MHMFVGIYQKMKSKRFEKASENAEWLISTAQSYESNGNVCAAKSWLLTAKSLFPKNFTIQVSIFIHF